MSHTARGASPPAVRCFSLTYKIFATVYRRPKSRFLFIHIGLRIDRISPKDAGSFGIRLRYAALKVRGGVPRGPEAAGGPGGQAGRVFDSRPSEQNKWSLILEVLLPRKEVIQPHVPVRLPCYDFTPLTLHTFGASPQTVGPATSGADDSGGVTGGVYKARERIHRGMLIRDY